MTQIIPTNIGCKYKIYRLFVGFAGVSILITGCPGLDEAFSFFYDSRTGWKRPLFLHNDSIVLGFSDELTDEEINTIVESEPLLIGRYVRDDSYVPGIAVMPLASDEDVLALLERLAQTPGVAFVNPFVTFRKPGTLVFAHVFAVSPDFIADFDLDVADEDILDLIDMFQLAVTNTRLADDDPSLKRYFLRVTSETGLLTLDMANVLHEHPLTRRAFPQFVQITASR